MIYEIPEIYQKGNQKGSENMQRFLILFSSVDGTQEQRPITHIYKESKTNGWGGLDDDLIQKGVIVDSIPEVPTVQGKIHQLLINPVTKQFSWTYTDFVPPERIEKQDFEKMKQDFQLATQALDDIILNS